MLLTDCIGGSGLYVFLRGLVFFFVTSSGFMVVFVLSIVLLVFLTVSLESVDFIETGEIENTAMEKCWDFVMSVPLGRTSLCEKFRVGISPALFIWQDERVAMLTVSVTCSCGAEMERLALLC